MIWTTQNFKLVDKSRLRTLPVNQFYIIVNYWLRFERDFKQPLALSVSETNKRC